MNIGFGLLKPLIDESVQRVLEENKSSEEYYKNFNKHECTECHTILTRDNYKKDKNICRKCYCKYMQDIFLVNEVE